MKINNLSTFESLSIEELNQVSGGRDFSRLLQRLRDLKNLIKGNGGDPAGTGSGNPFFFSIDPPLGSQ